MKRAFVIIVLIASLLLSGCAETGQMNDQPRFNPLSATTLFPDGRSARPSVPNTVSYSADNSANSPTNTGLGADGQPLVGFPEPVTRDLVARGQDFDPVPFFESVGGIWDVCRRDLDCAIAGDDGHAREVKVCTRYSGVH